MNHLHLDFETRSACDLTKSGADIYAVHPTTDVMCAAYAFGDNPVDLWTPDDVIPPTDIYDFIRQGGTITAWNATFECLIWNGVMVRRYQAPPLSPKQIVCTMAQSYAMALPGKLENAAAALGIDQQKDMKGNRVMKQLSQPREVTDSGEIIWWTPENAPEKFQMLYNYCKQDVVVERECGKRMMSLSPYELKVWQHDYEVNRRGVAVDMPAVKAAIKIVDHEKVRLDALINKLTGNSVATCTAVGQLTDWIKWQGIEVKSVAKDSVLELLSREDLPAHIREVLKLRQEAAKSSTAKFSAMETGASLDNRIRGTLQYSGAGTRRWAARRLQTHNFPRPGRIPKDVIRDVFELLSQKNFDVVKTRDTIDMLYGRPLDILSLCLRGFLKAAPGFRLIGADFSAIEARVLAWLAGEERVLEIFRSHGKIYEDAAANIYRVTILEIDETDPRRQVGKVAVLALGFQGGVSALQAMAKAYNTKLEPAYEGLWAVASNAHKERAQRAWDTRDRRKVKISREEFIASDLIKLAWRESNPNIVRYWDALETAAINAVQNPNKAFKAGAVGREITYKVNGSFLWCRLPSGGVLCYPYPRIEEIQTPWGQTKDGLTYMGVSSMTNKWERQKTYGGSLAENVTQATARDLLVAPMEKLETKGYKIVLHVHDEIISEVPNGFGSVAEFESTMSELPAWAKDLPLSAKGFSEERYIK